MLPAPILHQFLDGHIAHIQGIATIGYAQVELGEMKNNVREGMFMWMQTCGDYILRICHDMRYARRCHDML